MTDDMEDDDYWDYNMIGTVYVLSCDPIKEDVIERLHKVVEEITRKPVPSTKRRIGFL